MFEDIEDPRKQALLALAAGLLTPQSNAMGRGSQFAAALSHGINAGLLGYNEASQSQRRNRLTDSQLQRNSLETAALQRSADQQAKIDALAPKYFQNPQQALPYNDTLGDQPPQGNVQEYSPGKRDPIGYSEALMSIDPQKGLATQAAIQQMMQKQMHTLKPGETIGSIDLGGKFSPSYSNPDKPHWADLGDYIQPLGPTGIPVGPPIKKNMAPGESQRLGIERAKYAIDAGRYNFDTGLNAPSIGGGFITPNTGTPAPRAPVSAPQPAVPASQGQPAAPAISPKMAMEASMELIKPVVENFKTLRTAPVDIKNLQQAQILASNEGSGLFDLSGSFADKKLAIAKALRPVLGDIGVQKISDAETLQSRLFQQILGNLKKMDAQPSQQQQFIMQKALGELTTDPAALPRVLGVMEEVIRGKVSEHNAHIDTASQYGAPKQIGAYRINVPEPFQMKATNPPPKKDTGWGIRRLDGPL